MDMTASSQVVEIAERFFFGLNAKVEMMPVMALEDLEQGLSSIKGIVQRYDQLPCRGNQKPPAMPAARGFIGIIRRTSADVSDTPVGCFSASVFRCAGSCSTVASCPSRKCVKRTQVPSGNSSAS